MLGDPLLIERKTIEAVYRGLIDGNRIKLAVYLGEHPMFIGNPGVNLDRYSET